MTMEILRKGIFIFLLAGLFSCMDNTTDDISSDTSPKDTLFISIPKTKYTGIYDTLGYTLLINTISKEKYESISYPFSNTDSLRNIICGDKEDRCMEAMESYYISKIGNKVSRKDELLTLELSNGKKVLLKNNKSDGDGYEVYQFISLDKNNYFIVAAFYMESYAYLLINANNGKTYSTVGLPSSSPNNNFYIAGNCDIMAAFTFNGLELMTKTGDSILSNIKIDFPIWGPEEVKWKDDSTLYVKQKSQTGDDFKEEYNFAAIRIRKKMSI